MDRAGVRDLVFVHGDLAGAGRFGGWGFAFSPRYAATLNALFTWGRDGRLAEAKALWVADPLFAHSATIPGVSERLQQMVDQYGKWRLLNDDPHRPLDPPTKDQLGSIAAPTLVMVREDDIPDFHEIASMLTTGIPGACQLALPNAGHMANLDAPEAFNHALLEFLLAAK